MARLFTDGAELQSVSSSIGHMALANNPATDLVTFRSGIASWKCTNAAQAVQTFSPSLNTANTTYFGRSYLNFSAFPSTTCVVMGLFNTSGDIEVRCTTTGTLQLFRGTTQIGSDSAALSTGTWYRVEVSGTLGAGATNITDAELMLNGTSVASASGFTQARNGATLTCGFSTTPTTGTVYVDDVAVNDSTGAANNSWCGSGKVILMFPVSDNNRGAWTQGAGVGGTTNLWDAVNNLPPVGVADASATATSQIKNRTTTNPSNCDLNLNTYSGAGLGASDTVAAIQLFTNTGEDPATGTKAGTIEMVSNPVIGTTSFNFGNDAGLQGTYIGNWFWTRSAITQSPTVTIASAPVIRITCVSGATGSRSASCDFLASQVDYIPAAVAAAVELNIVHMAPTLPT